MRHGMMFVHPSITRDPPPELEESIRKILTVRDRHKEIFAAAFEKDVGSQEASKYELVEEWHGRKVVWYYRKRA